MLHKKEHDPLNNINKYIYSALSCVTQNDWNATTERNQMLDLEVKELNIVFK